MTTKKPIKNHLDVERRLRKAGWTVRDGKGSHKVGRGPNGETVVFYKLHGKDQYPKGMRCQLEKALAAAGVISLFVAMIAVFLM